MTFRFDGDQPNLSGAFLFGVGGLGVDGATIRATTGTGTHGPGLLYNDWDDSGDDAKEFRAYIETPPALGTLFAYEDGSFSFTGAPDGSHAGQYRLYVDGADLGLQSFTITQGDGLFGTSSITLGAITQSAAGTVTGAGGIVGTSAVTLGEITQAAAGTVLVSGVGHVTLGAIMQSASGLVTSGDPVVGSGAVTLGAILTAAQGLVFDAPTQASPRHTLRAKSRTFTISAPRRVRAPS